MGLFNDLLGRSRPPEPDLDALFSVPNAAVTLQTTLGVRATGVGSVCFQAASGPAFEALRDEVTALIEADSMAPSAATTTKDSLGYTWMTVSGDAEDLGTLCTQLHAVNSTLEQQGYGHGLLCTLVGFTGPAGQPVGLVYLYKQGTFYPFVPVPGDKSRNNVMELQVRDALVGELAMEEDLQHWLALWDAPGL